jgi:hypothetical protein
MTTQAKPYRYELVRGHGADFVAYQWKLDEGIWQTVSVWMVPQAKC